MVQCVQFGSMWFNIVFRGKTTLNNFEQRKALLNNIEQQNDIYGIRMFTGWFA